MTSTGTGSQAERVAEVRDRVGEAIGEPSEITSDSPRATESIASVAMNGGSLPYAISEAVDETGRDAGQRRRGRAARTTGTPCVVALREDGGRQRRHRADRQVDARRDDHEGHAEGEDGGHGRLDADVEEVVGGQEVARQQPTWR